MDPSKATHRDRSLLYRQDVFHGDRAGQRLKSFWCLWETHMCAGTREGTPGISTMQTNQLSGGIGWGQPGDWETRVAHRRIGLSPSHPWHDHLPPGKRQKLNTRLCFWNWLFSTL